MIHVQLQVVVVVFECFEQQFDLLNCHIYNYFIIILFIIIMSIFIYAYIFK